MKITSEKLGALIQLPYQHVKKSDKQTRTGKGKASVPDLQ